MGNASSTAVDSLRSAIVNDDQQGKQGGSGSDPCASPVIRAGKGRSGRELASAGAAHYAPGFQRAAVASLGLAAGPPSGPPAGHVHALGICPHDRADDAESSRKRGHAAEASWVVQSQDLQAACSGRGASGDGSADCAPSCLSSPAFDLQLAGNLHTRWRFQLRAGEGSGAPSLQLHLLACSSQPLDATSSHVGSGPAKLTGRWRGRVTVGVEQGGNAHSTGADVPWEALQAGAWGMALQQLPLFPAAWAARATSWATDATANSNGDCDAQAGRDQGHKLTPAAVEGYEAAAASITVKLSLEAVMVVGAPLGPDDVHTQTAPLKPLLLSTEPRLLVVDNFLSPALCDEMVRLADPHMIRSRVASGTETPSRTSSSYFFVRDAAEQAQVLAVEARIQQLFARPDVGGRGRKPVGKTEALQVIRYLPGEFYHEHYDNKAGANPTRDATIIIYLTETDAGGATCFPQARLHPTWLGQPAPEEERGTDESPQLMENPKSGDGAGLGGTSSVASMADSAPAGANAGPAPPQLPSRIALRSRTKGIDVYPMKGRAVVFWSTTPDGVEDCASIHAGQTVDKGMKWIATRWLRTTASDA